MTALLVIFWINAAPVGAVLTCLILRLLAARTHPLERCGTAWHALCGVLDRVVMALAAEPVVISRRETEPAPDWLFGGDR